MKPQSSHHPHRRLWLSLLAALVLLATGPSSAMWWPGVTRASTPDPVTAAWEKAKAAGSYAFTSNVHQKTLPVASISNVGRTSRSEDLYLEGQSDLRAAKLELTIWSGGGSVLQAESGVALRSEGARPSPAAVRASGRRWRISPTVWRRRVISWAIWLPSAT